MKRYTVQETLLRRPLLTDCDVTNLHLVRTSRATGRYSILLPEREKAHITPAVPSYAYNAGLKDFSDIIKYADKLEFKIYGIKDEK